MIFNITDVQLFNGDTVMCFPLGQLDTFVYRFTTWETGLIINNTHSLIELVNNSLTAQLVPD